MSKTPRPLLHGFAPASSLRIVQAALCLTMALAGWPPAVQADETPAAVEAPVIALAPPVSRAAAPAWPASLAQAAQQAGVPLDAASLLVLPVDEGPARLAIHADAPRAVASVMKLFTTGAALQRLGPAYTWKTEVGLDPRLLRKGVLHGPLFLKGQGDPELLLEHVQLWMARWRAAGLKTIQGDIVVDRRAFLVPDHDPAAFDGESWKPYNAGPDALLLNHRAVTLRFRPEMTASQDQAAIQVSMEPQLQGMRLQSRITVKDNGPCGDWRDRLTLSLIPQSGAKSRNMPYRAWVVDVEGSYPRACGQKDWPLLWSGDDVNDYAWRLLQKTWQQLGGTWQGQLKAGAWAPDAQTWMTWESPPLAKVVYDINKFSNNVMARQLFLTLGGNALPATLDNARQVVTEHVQTQTRDAQGHSPCDGPGLVLDNGSGLSRQERATPRCVGQWLRTLWASPVMPELLASLPITGTDGTAKRFSAPPGKAHIKTGSLDGVAAIAGVAQGDSGKRYVVVGVVNSHASESARPLMDALLTWATQDQTHE